MNHGSCGSRAPRCPRADLPGLASSAGGPLLAHQLGMLRNVKTSLIPFCSIVTGFGLLAGGCYETDTAARDAEVNFGCVPTQAMFAIDHTELQAVEGVAPSSEEARQFRVDFATERAQTLKVKSCKDKVHVSFDDHGTGYKNGELQIVDAYRTDTGIEGVIQVTVRDEAKLELSFHATAIR